MRRSYRFVGQRTHYYRAGDSHAVLVELLRSLGSTLVGQASVTADGVEIEVVDFRSRDDVLREIVVASRRVGLAVAQVEVTELLDAVIAGPGSGVLAAVGVSKTTGHLVAGLVAGVLVGALATYLAHRYPLPIQRYTMWRLEDDSWQVLQRTAATHRGTL